MTDSDCIDLRRVYEETFVREVSHHDELASTSTTALQLIAEGPRPAPLLVIAERQTAGRGRGANRWWSTAGALTFSIVIDVAELDARQLCKASLTTGLAVLQGLQQFVPHGDFALKWPNDVFLDGKKVAGILIERPAGANDRLVVGIGLNVGNSLREAPEEVQAIAISLADRTPSAPQRTSVLIACLQEFAARMDDLRLGDGGLLDQWREYCLLTGRHVEIDLYGSHVSGRCLGIDSDGALIVRGESQDHRCLGGIVQSFGERRFGTSDVDTA